VVILGGLDSIIGAVVAGIIMGLIQQFAAGYLDGNWGLNGTADVLPYIILLIILLFKPHGLFGTHEIERVLNYVRQSMVATGNFSPPTGRNSGSSPPIWTACSSAFSGKRCSSGPNVISVSNKTMLVINNILIAVVAVYRPEPGNRFRRADLHRARGLRRHRRLYPGRSARTIGDSIW
jgi:hypothetical protein